MTGSSERNRSGGCRWIGGWGPGHAGRLGFIPNMMDSPWQGSPEGEEESDTAMSVWVTGYDCDLGVKPPPCAWQ